jgi:CheY-like chemotaxis protein
MVRLVNDLLDVSRVTRGKIELRQDAIALGDVLAHAVETVRPAIAEREQELRLVPPPRDVMVKGDSTRLVQVFANLLSNASQYTSRKGLVEVTTEKGPELVVVRVRDTGQGIEPEALAHIFEAFVQPGRHAGSASAGLGLGLTLVRQLVEMHGGEVSAHSEGTDQGTTMTVRLPRVAPSEEHEPSAVPETPRGARAASRILVVEDNEAAAQNVAELLRMQGYDVRAVGDGPGALELARSFRPDVVLLDIGLPGMDGCDVARALRREHGDAPWIVALTGYGDAPSRRRILDAGADRHVVKPIDLDTLDAVLVGR